MLPYLSEKIIKQFTFNSIRTKLVFWFLVLGMIPLFVGILTAYYQEADSIKKETFDKLMVIRDLKAQRLNAWVERREADLEIISSDNELIDLEKVIYTEDKNPSSLKIYQDINALLDRYIKSYDDYEELFIINPVTGIVEISTTAHSIGINQSHNSFFTQPMEMHGFFIKNIYYSKFLKKNTMTFSVPIFCSLHQPRHIIGILVARVNLNNTLYPLLLDRVGLGKTGETIIVNKEAIALNELRYHAHAPLKLHMDIEPAQRAAQGKTGIIESKDCRGKNILAAYTYFPRMNWGFIVKQDLSELYAPIKLMLIHFIILIVVAVILIFIAAFFLARALAKPVILMKKTALNMQKGNFSARNHVTGSDEIADLGKTFNNMAESLESQEKLRKINDEITQTLVDAKDLSSFRTNILKKLVKVTHSQMGVYFVLNRDTNFFEHYTSMGMMPGSIKPFDALFLEGELGMVVEKRKITHLKDIPKDSIFKFRTFTGTINPKEIISIPVIIDNVVSGIVCLSSIKKYSKDILAIMKQPWTTAFGTVLSNMWANTETARLAKELENTNQELKNQAEELESQSEELQQTAEELQEQNLELETQKLQVEEANRLKTEFLSNMSHELRTPLNSVMALSRVLLMQSKDKLSNEEAGYLEIIERNGKNLLALINDILDLSKIEAGRMDVNPGMFQVRSVIEIILERLELLAKDKGIKLDKKIPVDLPQIDSDENRVHQILQNLMGNAVKFTETGKVSVSAKVHENNIHIRILDTGIGISQKDLPYIFDEFRQVDGSSARPYEGTGLGLAIAFKAARMLGGNISVKSSQEKGSIFTLTLPVRWEGPSSRSKPLILKPMISKPLKIAKIKPSQNTILLVEDNEAAIIQVKSILEGQGYIVDVAQGGQQALDYIESKIPGCIILDLMMPEIDGFQVLEKIRSTEATANIPVLILTARDLTQKDLNKLSANNIQQLIQKGDIDSRDLLLKIRSLFGQSQEMETRIPEYETPGIETLGSETPEPEIQDLKQGAQISESIALKTKPAFQKPDAGQRATILVIEDNLDNMITIKAIFHNKYNIIEAMDGEKGLQMALTSLPNLIFLDMSLPGMDGFSFITLVKQDKKACHIPVIALTARAMKGDREKIIAAGCDDYLSKPVDPEKILTKTRQWLGK